MKTQLVLVSEYLYDIISYHEESRPAWKTAIYSALLSNKEENFEILWTVYNEWSLAHQIRANKNTARNQNLSIESLDISGCDKSKLTINVIFNNHEYISIVLNESNFVSGLWEIENPKKSSILLNKEEALLIYELIKTFCNDGIIQYPGHPKFAVLEKVLQCSQAIYKDLKDPKEIAFLETIIGAAIFYLPNRVNEHFSGYISIDAIKFYIKTGKLVKDHILPRRRSASIVLNSEYSLVNLKDDFHNKFASFMYVTTRENKLLVNYNYENYDIAIVRLGIEKFPSPNLERFTHRELISFLKYLKENEVAINVFDDALNALVIFRN